MSIGALQQGETHTGEAVVGGATSLAAVLLWRDEETGETLKVETWGTAAFLKRLERQGFQILHVEGARERRTA